MSSPIKQSPARAAHLLNFAIATAAAAVAPQVVRFGIGAVNDGFIADRSFSQPLAEWLIFASTFAWAHYLCRRGVRSKRGPAWVIPAAIVIGVLNTGTCLSLIMLADKHELLAAGGGLLMGVSFGLPFGASYGFAFGIVMLPFVWLSRALHQRPSHDGYTIAALVSAVLFFVVGAASTLGNRSGACDVLGVVPQDRIEVFAAGVFSLIVAMSLSIHALFSDISLARFLRSARRRESAYRVSHVLDPLTRSTAPVLPLVRGSHEALLVQVESPSVGPFRDTKQSRALASMPARGFGALPLRVLATTLLLGGIAATLSTLVFGA